MSSHRPLLGGQLWGAGWIVGKGVYYMELCHVSPNPISASVFRELNLSFKQGNNLLEYKKIPSGSLRCCLSEGIVMFLCLFVFCDYGT